MKVKSLMIVMYKKFLTMSVILILLNGCALIYTPEERTSQWSDRRLCLELADSVYTGAGEWQWNISKELENRGINKDEKCRMIYAGRMRKLIRKYESPDSRIAYGSIQETSGYKSFDSVFDNKYK